MAEGFKIADAYVEIEAELDRDRLARTVSDTVSKSSSRIKASAGKKLGSSLLDGVGDAFLSGLKPALTLGFSGLSGLGSALASNPVTATIGVAVGAAIGTVAVGAIAAAITSGLGLLAGVGILGLGALILKDNKKITSQFEKSWERVFKSLERAAKPLIKPFVAAIKTVEKTLIGLEPVFKDIFKAAAPIVPLLAKSFGSLLGPIVKGLRDAMPGIVAAFEGLAAALPGIGQAIGDFFRVIFSNPDLVRRLTQQFGDFIAFLIRVAGPAIHGLTVIWGAFTNLIEIAAKGWGLAFKNLGVAFDSFTNGGLSRIIAAWQPLWDAIKRVWQALEDFAAADTDEELATSFETLVQRIKETWGPLKAFLVRVWDEVWAAIKKYWNEKVIPWWNNTAKPAIKKALENLAEEAFNALVQKAKDTIIQKFKDAGTWLKNAGKAIIQGLIDGINIALPGLRTLLNNVTGLIPDWKGPMEKDKKLLVPTGQAIMGGLESGLMAGMGSLERTLGSLTAAIPTMVSAPAAAGVPGIVVNNPVFIGAGSKEDFVRWLNDELDRLRRGHR